MAKSLPVHPLTPTPASNSTARRSRLRRTFRLPPVVLATIVAGSFVAAACGGSAASGSTAPTDGEASALASTEDECGTLTSFDVANFVDPTLSTNDFHPTRPGMQWVRGGTTLVGDREVPHQVITTMTDVVRVIDGVPAVAMLDESTDAGEVAQVGMDYLALDRDGNVWLIGGYTEEYEGGEYTNTEGAWLGAGERTLGILSPATVTADTPRWCIGIEGEDGETAAVVDVGFIECVTFDCFDDVRIVEEGEVGAPDNEHKYYAPGVGVINNVPLDASLHKDRFELINLVELSPEGLAEASQVVLDLEAHAQVTAPDVFGTAPMGERTGG